MFLDHMTVLYILKIGLELGPLALKLKSGCFFNAMPFHIDNEELINILYNRILVINELCIYYIEEYWLL